MVGLPDVVTRAKLDGDRFGHLRVVGGSNFRFSHCQSVIKSNAETSMSMCSVMNLCHFG